MDGCHGNFVISDVKLQMLKFCAKIKEYFVTYDNYYKYNAAGSETMDWNTLSANRPVWIY